MILAVFLLGGILISAGEEFGWDFLPTFEEIKGAFEDAAAPPDTGQAGGCEVHFIDVGQGDCSLIRSDGKNILIDAGENDQGSTVVAYLKKLGITKIDLLVATHPHSDHIGGMDVVVDELEIGKILMPRLPDEMVPTTKTYRDLLTSITNKGLKITPAKPGASYEFGAGALTVLGPNDDYDNLNDTSLVCRFTYGANEEASFFFTGDMESTAEKDLLQKGWNLESDVLKVGHHGSSTSTSKKFYRAVAPDYCVISVGDHNSYNHPSKKTLETISAVNGAEIYRTDFQGSVVFAVQGGDYQITYEKQAKS